MRRYMWPNSCLPSATALVGAAHVGSGGRFTLERVENHAAHYPRTLREWGRRLEARLTPAALGLPSESGRCQGWTSGINMEEKLTALKAEMTPIQLMGVSDTQKDQTLLQALPAATSADAAAFEALKRKWQYLFAYAAAGFQKGYITCTFPLPFLYAIPGPDLMMIRRSHAHVRPAVGCRRRVSALCTQQQKRVLLPPDPERFEHDQLLHAPFTALSTPSLRLRAHV
jgi:hypothetical protein